MNIKENFKSKYDNITINKDFNEIKNTLNYYPNIKETKKNLKPFIFSLASLSLIIIIMIPLLINGFKTKNEPNIVDFKNYEIHLNKITDNTEVKDQAINISLPLMYNACNLDENIDVNAKYEVLKDGIIQDKNHLDLTIGNNSYDVIIYKLNDVNKTYKLNITVGK